MTTATQQREISQYRFSLLIYCTASILVLTVCRMLLGDAMALVNASQQFTANVRPHTVEIASRTSPTYWLSGDGAWVGKWDGAGHDMWLAVIVITTNLWMSWECWRYAGICGSAGYPSQYEGSRPHSLQLRRVFLQCMFIHFGNGVFAWLIPAYWLLASLTIMSAWQLRRLNRMTLQLMRIHAETDTETVTAQVLATLDNPQLAAHVRLDHARDLLMQRVPYASG